MLDKSFAIQQPSTSRLLLETCSKDYDGGFANRAEDTCENTI